MPGFATTVDFTQNDHDKGDVMRQRIDGKEYDGMRNLMEDFRDAMPESPPSREPEESIQFRDIGKVVAEERECQVMLDDERGKVRRG